MSLTSRVAVTGSAQVEAVGSTRLDALEELRVQVQLIIAADEIASIMAQNPRRAENEV